ncbi:MAG: DNA repair protein RecN [Armatimonadota bacterium]|nr:MAG: DNA repair protein RecN [Armatimonadota bacterium]
MLTELHVENFALIDRLDVRFGEGLTVLTGETGAGKSIIVDALNAVLGERTDPDCVRSGCDRALVQAAFDLSGSLEVRSQLEEAGLGGEEILIVSREVTAQGRSQCRVNGRLTTLGLLRELTALLADVHGQHEHQLLLSPAWQLELLDAFAGDAAIELRSRYSSEWGAFQKAATELESLVSDERERSRLADLYRFQVGEIEAAGLQPGEEEELRQEAVRLANLEKLFVAAAQCAELLSGDESDYPGAVSAAGQAMKALESVASYDSGIAQLQSLLESAVVSLEEALSGIRRWRDGLDVSPERIDQVQSRLALIASLKRKYGDTVEDVLAYRDRVAAELDGLERSDERRRDLEAERDRARREVEDLGRQLSAVRRAAAETLGRRVQGELQELGMQGSRFHVAVEQVQYGPRGQDRVEFLISANPGEPLKPLARVASGGEASRTMLALKVAAIECDPVKTLVFDEIDAGIGGRTANTVGEKLRAISRGRQVLCVTHLPQIARFADHHLKVEKGGETSGSERTVISVRALEGEERVGELARMLGGSEESEAAVRHARELLGIEPRTH